MAIGGSLYGTAGENFVDCVYCTCMLIVVITRVVSYSYQQSRNKCQKYVGLHERQVVFALCMCTT